MGLNLSNAQIAKELDLNHSDVHQMTGQLRHGIVAKKPSPTLTAEVECDEVYIVAGHKGKPVRSQKSAVRTAQTAQGQAGTIHACHREAADFRHHPAWP